MGIGIWLFLHLKNGIDLLGLGFASEKSENGNGD